MKLNGLLTKASAWAFLALCAVYAGSAAAVETVVYYHNDALGSPVAATGEQGEVLWREAYSPYGDRLRKEDGGSNSLWYTAKPHEADFDLSYSGARWYMPATGRFTGMDPVKFREDDVHSFNRYLYANNNPYRYVDPDGRIPIAPIVYFLVKEAISMAVEHYTGVSTPTLKNGGKLAAKAISKGVTKGPIQHTKHSLNQKINREVKSSDELGAVRNPLKKTEVKYDSQGRPSEKFIGEKATVAVNPETGKVVTVHPTGSKLAERLKGQQGGVQ